MLCCDQLLWWPMATRYFAPDGYATDAKIRASSIAFKSCRNTADTAQSYNRFTKCQHIRPPAD